MQAHPHITSALTGVFLFGAQAACVAQSAGVGTNDRQVRQLERQLQKLQNQNQILARDLATSKKREAELNKNVTDLRLRFAALGKNLLNGGDDARLEAVKDAEVLSKRNAAIEKGVHNMMTNLREFLRTAIAADPDSRVRLETSIRELDAALGLGQKPRPQIAQGNLQHAKIISIDAESGLLVVNAGEGQSVRRGMTFQIQRGNRKVAEAIVAEIRKDFSGLLPTQLDNPKDQIRTGDVASVKTEQR